MNYSEDKMEEFVDLLQRHAQQEGINETGIADLVTYRASEAHEIKPEIYEPAILILGQGKKFCYLGGKKYNYSVGYYLTVFLPMPIEAEIIEASVEKPLLMAGIKVDLNTIASILLKMDRFGQPQPKPMSKSSIGMLSKPLNDELLEPIIRLLRTLDNPVDKAVLSGSILEEIHYRIIGDDPSGSLQHLLQQRGQIHQISRAVEHIHQNMEEMVSVDELARLANMSTSGFHRSFKEVMQMSPLQYAKSIKLSRAQTLIKEGKNANEAGFMVGYNSPAQFSREYKRHFGYSPSAT